MGFFKDLPEFFLDFSFFLRLYLHSKTGFKEKFFFRLSSSDSRISTLPSWLGLSSLCLRVWHGWGPREVGGEAGEVTSFWMERGPQVAD